MKEKKFTNKKSSGRMSKTIFRYLFMETLFAFFVSFLFFFFIFFVNQLLLMAKDILSKRVPFNQVALLVLYSLPSVIAMSTPFATLLGTLMTVGRMSSDNEILVMQSSGLSYKNIFIPTILVGIMISFISFGANDVLLPAGTIQFSRLYRKIMVSTPALEIESNSVKRFKDTVVITGNVTGSSIADLLILDKTSDGERRAIMAKNAEFIDAGKEGLRLDMENAFVHSIRETARRDYDYAKSRFFKYRIRQNDFIANPTHIGPREMSSVDVYNDIKEQQESLQITILDRDNKLLESALELELSLREENKPFTTRNNLEAAYLREYQISQALKKDRNLLIYRLEFYKKFSIPFGSLSFIFLAVPLGLLAKKSGQTVGFILGILISVVYWAFLLGGQNMGIRLGYSPFWTMWLPNFLCISIGTVMALFRIRR